MSFPTVDQLNTLADARSAYEQLLNAFAQADASNDAKDAELSDAMNKAEGLESDLQAAASLLEEADNANKDLASKVTELTQTNTDLQSKLETAAQRVSDLEAETSDLSHKISKLEAEAKTVETRAAEICASVGVEPAQVTPGGEPQQLTLLEQMRAIKNPAEQMAFFRKNKDAILKGA